MPDINDFVAGFSELLKADGVATFEFPSLVEMVANSQFDTAYHEHYSYLSLTAIYRIFRANGLRLFDVEQLSTHGGSLRVFAQRPDGRHAVADRLTHLLAHERALGVETAGYYGSFQKLAEKAKHSLLRFLLDARRQGLKVAAYGAAAKGNTLLNYAGIRPDLLPYVVDRNPFKIDRFLPGSRIPIVEERTILNDRPDLILIFPWNPRDEVVAQLSLCAAMAVQVCHRNPQYVLPLMRVVVTGGRGFIGREVVQQLLAAGYEVHMLGRSCITPLAGAFHHCVDLLHPGDLAVLAEIRAPFLVHLAWHTEPGKFWEAPENLDWVAASSMLVRKFVESKGRRAFLAGWVMR